MQIKSSVWVEKTRIVLPQVPCLLGCVELVISFILYYHDSKNFPTDPWSIPQTPNQQFMKEFLSFGGLGMSGVCSRGMLGSLE